MGKGFPTEEPKSAHPGAAGGHNSEDFASGRLSKGFGAGPHGSRMDPSHSCTLQQGRGEQPHPKAGFGHCPQTSSVLRLPGPAGFDMEPVRGEQQRKA